MELRQSIKVGNRRFVAFIIALLMVFECFAITHNVNAAEGSTGGQVVLTGNISASPKDNVIYKVTSNVDDPDTYTLTISGQGAMKNYERDCSGWAWSLYSWSNYNKITSVVVEEGVTYLSSYFMYASNVQTLEISASVKKIGTYFLGKCKNVKKINFALNSKLSEVGNYFLNNAIVEDITNMPKGINYGNNSFKDSNYTDFCSKINGMYIFNGEVLISSDNDDMALTDGRLTIPDNITYIAANAFNNQNITKVIFPKSIKYIKADSFIACKNLKNIDIPYNSAIQEIGVGAFYTSLEDKISGNALLKVTTEDISSDGTYTIPSNIKCIASEAAKNNKVIINLKYEVGCELQYIGQNAFYSCDELKTISLPNTVKKIGYYAFGFCHIESGLVIPETIEYIDDYAFYNSILADIELNVPSSLKYIGKCAFSGNYTDGVLYTVTKLTFEEGSNLEYLGDYAFYNHKLTSCELPASITYIGKYAFQYGGNYTEKIFTVAEGTCPYIDRDAFKNCYDTNTTFVLADTLIYIPESLRSGNYKVPDGVLYIASNTFVDNNFVEVDFNDVKRVYVTPFVFNSNIADNQKNQKLTKVTIPCNTVVEDILLLYGCTKLSTILIAENSSMSNYLVHFNDFYDKDAFMYGYGPTNFTVDTSLEHDCDLDITKATSEADGEVVTTCNKCGFVDNKVIYKPATITLDKASYNYTGSAIEPTVTVYDSANTVISADNYDVSYTNNVNVGTNAGVSVTFKGDYYDGTLSTNFTIVQPQKQATIKSVVNETKGVTITWNKISNVTGYKIYRKAGNGSYTLLKTIANNTTVSYTDTAAQAGTTYAYNVIGYVGNGTVSVKDTSASKIIKRIATVTIASVKNAATGITVTWNKATGAAKYQVFRRTIGNGWTTGWKWIKDTTGTSFTDTTAETGKTYEYIVRGIVDSSNGAFSTGKVIKRIEAPKTITCKSVSNGIQVSFSKVTGTTKYQIFRKTIGNGWETGWNWIKDTTSTSFIDTTAKKGTTYVYCVKVISGSYQSGITSSAKVKR